MKIITYHYIRDFSKEYPYFNSLYKKKFLKQLDYFEKKFGIIENEDEIYKKNNKILLTFDDGLKEHLFVAKELAKRKKIGIFFPLTKNFEGKKELLNVHKTHLIVLFGLRFNFFKVLRTSQAAIHAPPSSCAP